MPRQTFRDSQVKRARWSAAYTLLRKNIRPATTDLNRGLSETSDPESQVSLRLAFDLPGGVELDLGLRHVGEVFTFAGGVRGQVPEDQELDARLAWLLHEGLELSLVGRNLLHDRHSEAGAVATRNEIERSLHGKVTWRF